MNTYPTTPDLIDMLSALKVEDQIALFDDIKARYTNSFKLKENYRKNALSQIRSALNTSK